MRRGEIWWGAPPLPGGSRKRRPFLVVSTDAFNRNDRYPKVLVVHLSSVRRAGGPFRWETEVPKGVAGLPVASTVKCGEVYTLFRSDLSTLIGTLPPLHMKSVDRALAAALDLPAPG